MTIWPKGSKPNALINESSPYLLQHAYNPVKWHPWSPEILQKAKTENKPLLISIGYAACHWCHVMEEESFQDNGVAELMNQNFICIKIDREQRPDLDQFYMKSVQMIHGNGGWPLNCFALPDGKPFWGGTYFPKEQWMEVIERISFLFTTNFKGLVSQADNILNGIAGAIRVTKKENGLLKEEDLSKIIQNISSQFDHEYGGMAGVPKFPVPVNYQFLLHYNFHSDDKDILEFIELSLGKMAMGGIYDQIGGGFARYSVDKEWHIPHFEKMLYDNAQMIALYTDGFLISGNPLYKQIVTETVGFIKRELMSEEGAFYSSIDADSEGEEGKFYTWTKEQIEDCLGKDADLICKYYSVDEYSRWEDNRNVLRISDKTNNWILIDNQFSSSQLESLQNSRKKLLAERNI